MHHRSGTWVAGHFRNGSWVEGHLRSSTFVDDGFHSESYRRNRADKIHHSLFYGSITFKTKCWWCGEHVYFHRDKHGGCVFFNELGKPWPVHGCWTENIDQRPEAVRKALEDQSALIQNGINPKYSQHHKAAKDLEISGYIVSHAHTKEIEVKNRTGNFKIINLTIHSDKNNYQILIDERCKKSLLEESLVSLKCSVMKRGEGHVIYAHETRRFLPQDNELIFKSSLDVTDLIQLQWIYTKVCKD